MSGKPTLEQPRGLLTPGILQEALLRAFEEEIDPAGLLTPEERRQRALEERRRHFADLGRLSGAARRKYRDQRRGKGGAD